MIDVGTMNNSPVRRISAMVELFQDGSTSGRTFTSNDAIKEITIERIGEDKFFGFGVCHKANIKLIDIERALDFTTNQGFKVHFYEANGGLVSPFPVVNVTEVHRDEISGTLSITAYDAIYRGNERSVEELVFEDGYTIKEFAEACVALLGLDGIELVGLPEGDACFETYYEVGAANFGGYESIREALNGVADATQTFYFLRGNTLVFKRPTMGEVDYTITPNDYFDFKSGENRRITAVTSATQLGENITAESSLTGTNVYIWDNPFWELRDDVPELVEKALVAVDGLTYAQLEMKWRGNYLLEVGDYIEVIGKDGKSHKTFLLNDVIKYDGALREETQWLYDDMEEGASNPTNLGDAFKKTFAKVDKVNKEITLVVQETNAANEAMLAMGEEVYHLSSQLKQTAEDLQIEVGRIEQNGAQRVTTITNYTFDEEGLKIKSAGITDAELETTITEDGMEVSKEGKPVLVANNEGVIAIDLKATTFLVIGKNSRLQDYVSRRTACYWIGG